MQILSAALAAVICLPGQQVAAAGEGSGSVIGSNSAVYWNQVLPEDGNKDYRDDGNWHRLVLEYGDYSTNSVDSAGTYADISTNTATSWTDYAWYKSELAGAQPENWIGATKTEHLTNLTKQRQVDQNYYQNNEYGENGRFALYIKFAGYSEKNDGAACYYISPCDENGDRERKLWALDCCMDMLGVDVTGSSDYVTNDSIFLGLNLKTGTNVTGSRRIMSGIEPAFNLLTPTFDEYETLDNFQYAGVTAPWYARGSYNNMGSGWAAENFQNINNGLIRCDYQDNNKWIIVYNDEDDSWSLKSAGYVEWDWSDPDGDFAQLYLDPADQMEDGIAAYIKACSYAQVQNRRNRDWIEDGDAEEKEYSIYSRFYITVWRAESWRYYQGHVPIFTGMVPMIFLSEYAQNVYITGGWLHKGTTGFNPTPTDQSIANGGLSCSYGMSFNNTVTAAQFDAWLDEDIAGATSWYSEMWERNAGYTSDSAEHPADQVGVVAYEKNASGEVERYCTLDEIKASLPISVTSNWQPTAGKGAFTGMYIGRKLVTTAYAKDGGTLTLEAGTTMVLGEGDSNNDGAAYLGTPAAWSSTNTGSYTYTGPNVVVEKGAALQIDGPTYAALGTSITVRGSLIINSGGMLCMEEVVGTGFEKSDRLALNMNIEGGSVYISRGAILDLSYGNLTIEDNGNLVNNGVFIQGTYGTGSYNAYTTIGEGIIENDTSAWYIIGANVRNEMRQTLLRSAVYNGDLVALSNYISDVYDYSLGVYAANPGQPGLNYADLYFEASSEDNVFRNCGYAFVAGAIRGAGAGNSSFIGGGTLYRARDLYANPNVSVQGASYTNHQNICNQSGKDPYEDTTLDNYYAITGVEYTNGNAVVDHNAATEALKNNVLALRVGTGSDGTSKISSFKLTYVDKNGVERVEYIDPTAIANTYHFVSQWQYCNETEDQAGNSLLKTQGGDAVMSAGNFSTELEPLSNVVYLFQTLFPVSYVETISFEGSGTDVWTCTELSVYRVQYLYPLAEYGYRSEDWYVPFSGTLLASASLQPDSDGVRGYTFSWSAEEIVLGTGYYQLNVYEAPNSVKSKTDKSGFAYYNVSHDTVSYTTDQSSYAFSATLADTEAAGIESFYNVASNQNLTQLLNDAGWSNRLKNSVGLSMQLTYQDTAGSVRKVTLPFTQSAVEWAYDNMSNASRTESLHGIFQQGEDIVFSGILPDFSRVIETYITYSDENVGDTVSITALSVSNPSYTDVAVTDGMLKVEYPDTALYFYTSPDTDGTFITNGQTMNVKMKAWNGTENLQPQAKGSRYLVVVQTDEMSDAATVNDIVVSFTYKTLNNTPSTTGQYSLRAAVNDYYGYWLSADGTDADCAYETAVSAGGQMYFVLDIANLYKFTSATFTLNGTEYVEPVTVAQPEGADTATQEQSAATYPEYASNGKDEWQMSAITIYELSELGEREVQLNTGSTTGNKTNRIYFRDNVYGSRGAINRGEGPLMIGVGQSKTISFEDGGSVSGDEPGKNNATKLENLSYEDTKQDFGFNTARTRYAVTVKVEGTSITSAEDGDCGSKNQFYFQLVFQDEDGNLYKSPYTLANQQLQSDGFRTGTAEKFTIYTNDDYGTPVQVNIIPDDTSTTSDVFDKLCIDYILVSKTSGTGVNMSWRANDVGWIDIEYKEDAEEQDGRTDEELIRSFELREDGYSVWLEFGIETAADYIGERQFVGQVEAEITYRDSTGAVQTTPSVPVIANIAEYANRLSELDISSEADGSEVSVPTYMFVAGSTNRFHVEFEDISSLEKIKIKVTPQDDTGLKITKVFARQVYDKGTLSLNLFNEYERYYSITPQDLTATNNAKAVKIEPKGGSAAVTLDFNSGNTIQVDLDGESVQVEEGTSEGENDTISLTASLADTTGVAASAALPVRVVYKNVYGDAYAVTATLTYSSETGKFMVPEYDLPKTPNIGMPYQVEVIGGALAGKELTGVTVSQIREKQVLEQFDFIPTAGTLLDTDIPVTVTIEESQIDEYAKSKGYTTENQTVYLLLGEKTQKTLLTGSKDLQVALIYTEKDDPYAYEHTSDFVSALDCGYTVINSGTLMKIPMQVENIGTVKSVLIRTTETGIAVNAVKGCIAMEETSNLTDTRLSTGWVNLSVATGLITVDGTAMLTDGTDSVTALTESTRITPVTVSTQLVKVNRADAKVRVTLCYRDTSGNMQTVTSERTANEWNRDGVGFLVEGFYSLQYYKIETYDKDDTNSAGVTVSSMSISWYDPDGVFTSSETAGNTILLEGTVLADYVITTQLTGTIISEDGKQTTKIENNLVSTTRTDYATLKLAGGDRLNITANLPGCAGELELVMTEVATNKSVYGTISEDAAAEVLSYTAQLPENNGTEDVRYCLTVRSRSIPDKYAAIIYIDVQPQPSVEGVVQREDGSTVVGFTSYNADTQDSYAAELNPGETLIVYARAENATNTSLLYTLTPSDGSFTVTETANCTVAGKTGSYTKYVITAGTTQTVTNGSFKVYSAQNPDVCYTLSFQSAATE